MAISYEIDSIRNASGSKKERKFIKLNMRHAEKDEFMYEHLAKDSGLTRGTVKLVMSEFKSYMLEQLKGGNRVHLPDLGYFAVSTKTTLKKGEDLENVTDEQIKVKGFTFKPDKVLLTEARQKIEFNRYHLKTGSREYSEEQMRDNIAKYLETHEYIDRVNMQIEFNLRKHTALKWLKHFCSIGFLVNRGQERSPAYYLA